MEDQDRYQSRVGRLAQEAAGGLLVATTIPLLAEASRLARENDLLLLKQLLDHWLLEWLEFVQGIKQEAQNLLDEAGDVLDADQAAALKEVLAIEALKEALAIVNRAEGGES